MSIGDELKQLRIQAGLSQRNVADLIDVNTASVCRWESGERVPKRNKLEKLAVLFHRPVAGVEPQQNREKSLGERLQVYRLRAGLTLEQVAAQLHVTAATVSRWETGTYMPKPDKLKSLASLYHCTIAGIDSNEDDEMTQGEKLREFRQRANLSQAIAAELIHCLQKDISRWENDVVSPKGKTLRKLADAYHCRVNDLV